VSRKKVFRKIDLSIPQVDLPIIACVDQYERPELPPVEKKVFFNINPTGIRSFDFSRYYAVGIDEVTYACQRQVERFLHGQDAELSLSTIVGYCDSGLKSFLDYLSLRSSAMQQKVELAKINRGLIDGYLAFLQGSGLGAVGQKSNYDKTKPVIKALCRRGLIKEIFSGDEATFPKNPFPKAKRAVKGEAPLSKAQQRSVAHALSEAIKPLFDEHVEVTGALLVYAYLYVALTTGRNTVPLLEMTWDCLHSHPRDDKLFLMLYKRRGHKNVRIAVRNTDAGAGVLESISPVRATVVGVIKRVMELSRSLRTEAPQNLQCCVWLFRAKAGKGAGTVKALTKDTVLGGIASLVKLYKLQDSDGRPLRLNVSRLRKTFVNRIYEILDGDVVSAAVAAGHTPEVSRISYMRPGEESQKNWMFMGNALTAELLNNKLGATERTPVGRCSDPLDGEFAPKRDGAFCMSFLNCLRCKNYVVTGDDLYKLFSFYWRLLKERTRMNKRRWKSQFAHIIRLIDRDVAEAGVRKGIFKEVAVVEARERARQNPHPFWASEDAIGDLKAFK